MGEARDLMSRHRGMVGFAVGVLAFGSIAGGGAALASIPSTSTGQYTACALKKGGAVRVIDYQAGKRCTTREKTIRWSKGWRYRGTWAASTAYAVGDVAVENGSSFLAKLKSSGRAPSASPAYWGLVAQAAPAGATGPAGQAGSTGPAGPAGPVSVSYVVSPLINNSPGTQTTGEVACPTGQSVTGGGVRSLAGGQDAQINSSNPVDTTADPDSIPNNGWSGTMSNTSVIAANAFFVYAMCTSATSVS